MSASNFLMDALKATGLRLTPQRVAICRLLEQVNGHPSAQEIYEILRPEYPSLSLATVYNTLESLVKAGAINNLGTVSGGPERFDALTGPHVNLACLRCQKVLDFPSPHVEDLQKEVQETSGYRLLGARVVYYGICPECQKKEINTRPPRSTSPAHA